MRKHFDIFLSSEADIDNKIRLIIADVGEFPVFLANHPDKFLNVGVSESNAIGIAGGLASQGYRVFVYGVSSFFIYRAYEQFKHCVAYWKQNVIFVGVGFGWKYFFIGTGHFSSDDIALMRLLPNVTIATPNSLGQLKRMIKGLTGPSYIRLTANILSNEVCSTVTDMENIFVTYGEMCKTVLNVEKSLQQQGINIGHCFLSLWTSKYIDRIKSKCKDKRLFVVEDHCNIGGIYDVLMKLNLNIVYYKCLPNSTTKIAAKREDLVKEYGLDTSSIEKDIKKILA